MENLLSDISIANHGHPVNAASFSSIDLREIGEIALVPRDATA